MGDKLKKLSPIFYNTSQYIALLNVEFRFPQITFSYDCNSL